MANTLPDPHAAIVIDAGGVAPDGQLNAADGRSISRALGRSQRAARRRAFLLVLPLLLFIVITFVVPIGQMLARSVYNDGFSARMPAVGEWFAAHPVGTPPDEAAYAALVSDLAKSAADKSIGVVGTRINYDYPGTRSLFTSTGRKVDDLRPPFIETLPKVNAKWADPALWAVMREASRPLTPNFYLAAMDRTKNDAGKVVQVAPQQRVYLMLFLRTFILSLVITGLTFILGFPIAHLLATLPTRKANLLMVLVLLPFWTSLLVRTTAWIVLLQQQGVINDLLVWLGFLDNGSRLQMIYNRTGTLIAMTHVLLPFMILPLYSVMRSINPSYERAARSLGATSWTAFRRVYFPQTLPGLGAGALLVFILAVGYYITPALVGGSSGQLISNMIAVHMTETLNWSLAAALAALLLGGVLILYYVYDRLVGIDNLKLG
ncbi:ABC transporter permease [Paracoccus suum]|uniref:ABC transporter permease n=1 Tax=Paracoccus suum TaxID=2259340 RepID=A0A344PNB0_9RHOB|nr:ABC transporter permease [Paracoccus suum]AXC50865.1 ABC transporter permease [Paracoccus suum]